MSKIAFSYEQDLNDQQSISIFWQRRICSPSITLLLFNTSFHFIEIRFITA